MFISDLIGIIADDLTGANDTALQMQQKGASTKILLEERTPSESARENTQAWAISTESRNLSQEAAYNRVKSVTNFLKDNFNFEYYYKKIDSTLRGHIAIETLTVLKELEYDAAIVIPAFPAEGRITVGGYHLLKGLPISMSDMAMDPVSPILESHIPTMFKEQVGAEHEDIIGCIELKTVMNGAGPILKRLNELIESGKKLIVADAVSTTNIEQIVLAINKLEYKILPTGTAAFAKVLANVWLGSIKKHDEQLKIPNLPKLILSGSATQITAKQIERLEQSDDFQNVYMISLKTDDIINNKQSVIIEKILDNLGKDNIILVHTSSIMDDYENICGVPADENSSKSSFYQKITDFLGVIAQEISAARDIILIMMGGETSYKCCKSINSTELDIMGEAAPAIAIARNGYKRWIVTKSGNLGTANTLVDILNYLNAHE